MGPIILLDKSTFQALSGLESQFLHNHFYVNIAPLLLYETIGDLSKYGEDKDRARDTVARIAKKFWILGSKINIYYSFLLHDDLLGNSPAMDGRIPISDGKPFRNKKGELGFIIEDTGEYDTIRRWAETLFTQDEESLSVQWREGINKINLESIKRRLKDYTKGNNPIKNFYELDNYLSKVLSDKSRQFGYLLSSFDMFDIPRDIRKKSVKRWNDFGATSFKRFAPYTFHCFKVNFYFITGLKHSLIGPRASNWVDIQYLYYIPFSNVFTSDDKFLLDFAPMFKRPDQFVVRGTELKSDLRNIIAHWESLSDAEKHEWSYEYGSYPPENENSIVYQLWRSLMKPKPRVGGNFALKMTPEQQKELGKQLHDEYLEAAQQVFK